MEIMSTAPGKHMPEKMIAAYEAGEELPQAVISANDLMAAAFLQTMKRNCARGKDTNHRV